MPKKNVVVFTFLIENTWCGLGKSPELSTNLVMKRNASKWAKISGQGIVQGGSIENRYINCTDTRRILNIGPESFLKSY